MTSDPAAEATQALAQAEELAAVAVDQAADGHVAFRIATELARAWQETADRVTHLRGRAAARIRDEESISLRTLADRLDMAPSGLHRIIHGAPKSGGTSE